jgi:hypothetical protein
MSVQSRLSSGAANPTVEAELGRLPTTPIVNLRKQYRELFQTEPPKAFGPDLLRRSIAHRIQEKAYGGLPAPTQRLLDQLVKAARTKPNGRLELPSRIKPGSELVRTWDGNTYRVIYRTWAGAGIQLAGRATGGLRGLYQKPGVSGLEGPTPEL